MNVNEKNIKNFLQYLFTCFILFILIYFPIILNNKMYMYIDIGADTYSINFPVLSYVNRSIQDLKIWDNSIGLGNSSFQFIASGLGSIFNWPIFLFDNYNIDIGIFISLIFKYIILSFSAYGYCKEMQLNEKVRSISSMLIVFSGWFIGWGQHYTFATIFTLFITGLYFFERWLKKGKWLGFVISIAFLAVISQYFLYMCLLFFGVYYLFRYFILYQDKTLKKFIMHGGKTIGLCFLGISLAGIIFIPGCLSLLDSPRVGAKVEIAFPWLDVREYFVLWSRTLSNNILGINDIVLGEKNFYEAPFMYAGILTIFTVPALFNRKNIKKIYLLIAVIMVLILLCFNYVSYIFNGFSGFTSRWTFVLIPVLALAAGKGLGVIVFQDINMKYINCVYALINITIVIVSVAAMYNKRMSSITPVVHSIICITFISLFYWAVFHFRFNHADRLIKVLGLILCLELIVNGYISVNERGMLSRGSKEAMSYYDETNYAIEYLKESDNTFYRVSKKYDYVDLNDSLIQNFNGEKLYMSPLHSSYWKIQELFDLRTKTSNYFKGFDDKQALRDITCGKYMLTKEPVDYFNYSLIYAQNNRYIYQNKNALEFGVLYNKYMEESTFSGLDNGTKQNLLYEECVIADDDVEHINNITRGEETSDVTYKYLPCNFEYGEKGITVNLPEANTAPLLIKVNGVKGKEISGRIRPILGEELDGYDYIPIVLYSDEPQYYRLYNVGITQFYLEVSPNNISAIEVCEINGNDIDNKIEMLKEKEVNLKHMKAEHMVWDIDSKEESILFVPIIYNADWKASVNGESSKVLRANGGFCAMYVPKGKSTVSLIYSPAGVRYGEYLSIGAIIIILLLLIYGGIKNSSQKEKDKSIN